MQTAAPDRIQVHDVELDVLELRGGVIELESGGLPSDSRYTEACTLDLPRKCRGLLARESRSFRYEGFLHP